MINTRLILIEGFPGSGKTTTTQYLGSLLQQKGIACHWFLEDDVSHPINCLDYEIRGLLQKMIPLWKNFVKKGIEEGIVTIIESRLWQNTAFFMYMSNTPIDDIIDFNHKIGEVLTPLSPVLVYLDQIDPETAIKRLSVLRGEQWIQQELQATIGYPWFVTRGLDDFTGWIQLFQEWHKVAARLYVDWPHAKIRIMDAHENWESTYQKVEHFLLDP